jgi:hypothetical protein
MSSPTLQTLQEPILLTPGGCELRAEYPFRAYTHSVLVGLDGAGKSALVFALQHPTVTVGKTTYRNPLESAHHYTSAHPHGGGSSGMQPAPCASLPLR